MAPRTPHLIEVLNEVGPLDQLHQLSGGAAHQQPRLANVARTELLGVEHVAELTRRRLCIIVVVIGLVAAGGLAAPHRGCPAPVAARRPHPAANWPAPQRKSTRPSRGPRRNTARSSAAGCWAA